MSLVEPHNNAKVNLLYWFIAFLVFISFTGIPYVKYLIYASPFLIVILAYSLKCAKFQAKGPTLAFLIVLLYSLLGSYWWDFNSIKKFILIFCYTFPFLFINFENKKINVNLLLLLTIIAYFYSIYFFETKHDSFSLLDSKSKFESTLCFPLGLLAIYYLIEKKYILYIVSLAATVISFKKIVIIVVLCISMFAILPDRIKSKFTNRFFLVFLIALFTFLSILFAIGFFDEFIYSYFGKSANDLSKGRRFMWECVLQQSNWFKNYSFFYGNGLGSVVSTLKNSYNVERILLHNDLMSFNIEFGIIIYAIFTFLMFSVSSIGQKILALSLLMMSLTDNIFIYQHVMYIYFILHQQLAASHKYN